MQFLKSKLQSKLQIIFSSVIAILVVATVAGATTVGTNIATDGTLSVTGTTTISGALAANNASVGFLTFSGKTASDATGLAEGATYYNSDEHKLKIDLGRDNESYLAIDHHFQPSWCPSGYVPVPGDASFGTQDGFCVMKYEAKCDNDSDGVGDDGAGLSCGNHGLWLNNTADCKCSLDLSRSVVSTPSSTPITMQTQVEAMQYCNSLGEGYHLITNDEYMTIARNMEQQPGNWSSGIVGSSGEYDGMYTGHNQCRDAWGAKGASYDDSDGYYGYVATPGTLEKRTMVLSNGQTIWDLAGNVGEMTASRVRADQTPVDATPATEWLRFDQLTDYGALSYDQIRPADSSYSTNYRGIQSQYSGGSSVRVITRGGNFNLWSYQSVFNFMARSAYDSASENTEGFRCVYAPSKSKYVAGNDLDISGGAINIESQLNYVSSIYRSEDSITLETNTSGNIILVPAGNVGIGTTTPAATLDINGYMRLMTNSSEPAACSADNDGAIALTSSYLGCVCNGTGWISIASSTEACVW